MTQIIKPESVDFNALIKNSTTLNLDCKSKMIETLNKEFTEEESRWYIANLYVYMNYHPTNDYPINLETLVKLVGFAHKKNAKRTLENNFTKDEDYKITVLPSEQGKFATEEIMLNVDTFKNMCMLVKTEKSKEIRKYYVKLENIYNGIVKKEIENTQILLQQKETQLQIKDENISKLSK
jgi:phage anti-repressor protein